MNRRNKLILNTATSFVYQITTIICGFILPRLILQAFGSEVNGLVNSITQFLSVITFLELGVGTVVESSLYKPLAEKDNRLISETIASAGKFFRNFACILLLYIIILIIFYNDVSNHSFDWIYTASLIAVMSISFFSQYYLGIVDRLLLTADQRGYIQYTAQTVTLIINTFACALLIKLGAGIHAVKLTTSLIYLFRPLVLRVYVNNKYKIDRKIKYSGEPIQQKWNGVAQHIASVVLDSTDSIVLTVFSTLSDVSIYSVYNLVVSGVKQLLLSTVNGIRALIGELWARQELAKLRKVFGMTEWGIHTVTILIFGCTGILILPFVSVYTKDVIDANYVQPLFAILITLANATHCLRLPYHMMILCGGHFKQTQWNYAVTALINIVISVLAVKSYGLIGVAIGTLISMLFQTIWMAYYVSKNLIKWPFQNFVKQISIDILIVITGTLITKHFNLAGLDYISWIIMAIQVFAVWCIISLLLNLLFYRRNVTLIAHNLHVKIFTSK